MKKKKLKKILDKSLVKFKKRIDNENRPVKVKNQYNDQIFSECSDEVKAKSRNMINRLLSLRDTLSITINEHHIIITSEYGLKSSVNNINHYSVGDYFNLDILPKLGFIMTFKDKRLAFKDETLYSEILSNVSGVFTELNNSNFDYLYNEVMVESGLARGSNLDELLPS
jgi:hypothetical protein